MPPLTSVSSPAQVSSEIVIAQLLDNCFIDDLPITLQKGKHTCTQHSLLILFLILIYLLFVHLFFRSCSIFKNVSETLSILGWTQAMQEKMMALEQNET